MAITDKSMQVSQFIRSDRRKVFHAWTKAERVQKWLYPEECRPISNQAIFDVGGDFSGTIKCGVDIHTAIGTYKEIVPGRKLVFTHQWEGPDAIETEVVVEFLDKQGGCEVKLTQQGFATAASAKGHQEGWASTLRNLARQFG
jgi:uncharacterized protein YndB with AHSA1/START domain